MITIQSAQLQTEGMGPSRTYKGVYMLEMLKERKAALEAQGKKGFTLMEMLIVIAIIAILIAIAIPLFTSQLNAAKQATDESNGRALYAQLQADYMLGDIEGTPSGNITAGGTTTYRGTTYKWSDGAGGTISVGTNTPPVVHLTSYNNVDVTFGTASSSGGTTTG